MSKSEHHKKTEHHKKEAHGTEAKKGPAIKLNIWMVTTAVLVIALVLVLVVQATASTQATQGVNSVGASECGDKILTYLNKNLVQPGTEASLINITEKSGIYEITTSYQGRPVSVYSSLDCGILFLSALNTTQDLPTAEEEVQAEPVKTDKPEADLYIMAFCPYGVQAENIMKPVVDLLGSSADINVRFIASVNGDDTESVSSLHGLEEAKEDLRQLCVMKYYPDKFWEYLMDINANCYSIYRDSAAMDACWKNASTKLGMDVSNIETCAYGSEGLDLLKIDEALANQNSVTGSPTLIINGQRYSGSRSSEAFKQAICEAFTTAPSVCSQTVNSSSSSTASGSC